MKTNNESWTKKGAVIGSQDDCVIEVTKEYVKVNPDVSWDNVGPCWGHIGAPTN